MSGDADTLPGETELVGDSVLAVTRAAAHVAALLNERPTVIGGLAVLCRLSNPYRATIDLDIVERHRTDVVGQLEILRAAPGAREVEPSAVAIPTEFGEVEIDVLVVNQAEIDNPSEDPGDRLHATAHAWALETAADHVITAHSGDATTSESVRVKVSQPGPLIAMKLQAIMNRTKAKEGTDLLDIVRLALDRSIRDATLEQLASCPRAMRSDIALHVNLYFAERSDWSMTRIREAGGEDLSGDDLELVRDLLLETLAV